MNRFPALVGVRTEEVVRRESYPASPRKKENALATAVRKKKEGGTAE